MLLAKCKSSSQLCSGVRGLCSVPAGVGSQMSSRARPCSVRFWRKSGRAIDDAALDGEVGKWLFGRGKGRSSSTGECTRSTGAGMRAGGAGWAQGDTALSACSSLLSEGGPPSASCYREALHLPASAEARCWTVESTHLITAALKAGRVCLTTVPEWFLLPS